MRNGLPKKINKKECGIVNLDNKEGEGTHWVAYKKVGALVDYFDSFGDLQPPVELKQYFLSDGKKNKVFYNYLRYQRSTEENCGQLSLLFLINK